jgi:hypothetical protein
MKHILFTLNASLLLFSLASFAQKGQTGIYKTESDYLNGKPALSEANTHVRLHEIFNTDKLEVIYKDSTFSFHKNELFGYINADGESFRFFKGNIYSILNPGEEILLYKTSSGTGLKNSPWVEHYFFSKEAGSEILPLSLPNLEALYAKDIAFETLLEIAFKSDSELNAYDSLHQKYKLSRLYELSKGFERSIQKKT